MTQWLFAFLSLLITSQALSAAPTFRLTLGSEPQSLSPFYQRTAYPGFVYTQVHASLLRFRDGKLKDGLASQCIYKTPTILICDLKKNLKFSDGTTLTAHDFVNTWKMFLDPATKSLRPDILGRTQSFTAKDNQLIITLKKSDPEFIYYLASPLLAPVKNPHELSPQKLITSGAFRVKSWNPPRAIELESNPNFYDTQVNRPNLIFKFIEEETLALKLYENKELDFLRRLPTAFIPQFASRKDYFEVPLFRMDYFGFRKDIPLEERRALSESIDYKEFQKLYSAKGTPGCFGIPREFTSTYPCLKTDIPSAKKLKTEIRTLTLSQAGGDEFRRTAEWLIDQWKKHIGRTNKIRFLENKFFLSEINQGRAELFRKGLNMERPSCLAAVEWMHSTDSENTLKISDPEIDSWIEEMQKTSSSKKQKQLCGKILKRVLNQHYLIPTGPMYFSILVNPEWSGWIYNELGELDLSNLKLRQAK